MEQFLYRGVSKEMYEKSGGKLIPRGSNIEVTMTRSDHNPDEHVELLRNGRFLREHSEMNTLRAHQMKSGMHDGAFISTSILFDVASEFATEKGTVVGFVYKIDPDLFEQYGVVARQDPIPKYVGEAEVSIRSEDGGEIPEEVIIEIIEVPARKA